MELRQLEHFVAVANQRHFTRAAIQCNISQSALSMSIRALERELGAALFVRSTRQVELTEAGRTLEERAARILAEAAAARQAVYDVDQLIRGTLRVGGVYTHDFFNQAALLAHFRASHPALTVNYTRASSMALVPAVEEGEIDIAFVSMPAIVPDGLLATPLATHPLVFLCRPDHRLAGLAKVSLKALADETFVGAPAGSIGSELIDRVFAAGGTERNVPYVVNDLATIVEFVSAGLGVTFLQKDYGLSQTHLVGIPLADKTLTWTLAAITPTAARITAAAAALLELCPRFVVDT
ncbi:MAG: hypothetical protein QOF21_717 [Actinomycetota bacterium]